MRLCRKPNEPTGKAPPPSSPNKGVTKMKDDIVIVAAARTPVGGAPRGTGTPLAGDAAPV